MERERFKTLRKMVFGMDQTADAKTVALQLRDATREATRANDMVMIAKWKLDKLLAAVLGENGNEESEGP